jgi:hypothetical protein
MAITNPDIIKILDDHMDYNDHPIYLDTDDVTVFFDNLKQQWWTPISNKKCSFCRDEAQYGNSMTYMWACDSCMGDFINGEIDLINPEDHDLSLYLRRLLCDWIDTHYFAEVSSDLFDDCTYNTCYVCNTCIEANDDNVAIANNAKALGHLKCVQQIGFRNLYSEADYNSIVEALLEKDEYEDSDDGESNMGFKDFCAPALYTERSDITQGTVTKRAKHINY